MDVKREGNGFAELEAKLKELSSYEGRTGFFEEASYPVKGKGGSGMKVASVAAIQEFGSVDNNIPPRPFFRPAVQKNKTRWLEFGKSVCRRVLQGKLAPSDAMEAVADLAAEDVKQSISDVYSPPLSPRTLAARRAKGNTSEKPLIDTKLMIRSVEGRSYKE